MTCKYIHDQNTLSTYDNHTTVWVIPPCNNISHTTALRAAMAALAVITTIVQEFGLSGIASEKAWVQS